MRVRSTDEVELEVHDLGGEGPPLLFVHATGFHGRVWEPLASRLDGFHKWSIDMRAHGDSTPPVGRALEWEGFADDICAVIDHLGLQHPFAVGHSKGGAALVLAEERHPGTFRALYVYEPVIMTPEWAKGVMHDNPLSNGARRRRASFPSVADAIENYSAKPPFDTLDVDVLALYVEHGFRAEADGITLKLAPELEADVYAHGSAHQAFASLGDVHCPVTVAIGVETVPPAVFARPIVAALPRGTLVEFGDLGHFGPLEEPGRIAESVRASFASA